MEKRPLNGCSVVVALFVFRSDCRNGKLSGI